MQSGREGRGGIPRERIVDIGPFVGLMLTRGGGDDGDESVVFRRLVTDLFWRCAREAA